MELQKESKRLKKHPAVANQNPVLHDCYIATVDFIFIFYFSLFFIL